MQAQEQYRFICSFATFGKIFASVLFPSGRTQCFRQSRFSYLRPQPPPTLVRRTQLFFQRRRDVGGDKKVQATTKLRYFFPGQRRQDGKIAEAVVQGDLTGRKVRTWLCDEGVPAERYHIFVYDYTLEGFVRVGEDDEPLPVPPFQHRIFDIKLDLKGQITDFAAVGSEALKAPVAAVDADGGWFGIGIFRGKTEANHGTLWRTALSLGASFVFTIGQRYRTGSEEISNDTLKVHRHIPMLRFDDLADFTRSCPYSAPWVAIEMGGSDLATFKHPQCAVYILGAEDHGLPKTLVSSSPCHVTIPAARPRLASYNVATAGALVMYDRWIKLNTGIAPEGDIE